MSTFAQHLVRFTKVIVVFAAAWTGLCAVMLTTHQIIAYLQTGEWDAFPISSVIRGHDGITYTIASSRKLDPDKFDFDEIWDALLTIPAIIPLLIALVGLLYFWAHLSRVEKEQLLP